MDSPIKTPVLDWKSCIDPIKGEGGDNDGEEQDFPGWTDQELSAEQSAAWAETLERLQLFDPHHTVMVKKAKTAAAAPAAATASTAAKQAAFKASLPAKSPAAPSPQAAEAAAGLAGRRARAAHRGPGGHPRRSRGSRRSPRGRLRARPGDADHRRRPAGQGAEDSRRL